jgi:superfamily II DNA/RNA helicase
MYHSQLLAKLDLSARAMAGQVFRRILMAEEFLLRYLADVARDSTEKWADYLTERYVKHLDGHRESLKDRVNAYLETLVRAQSNKALLDGYNSAATNSNVVQIVKGGMDRDRYFLGFNTPYRPEVLVSTAVGQEGIDLHRECRHIIHHDLCWNPATIAQRTGRVDRIGSKVERERLGSEGNEAPTLEIAVPYLAATYDERMFEELYRRAQLFEVTLGGDMRVEGRVDAEEVAKQRPVREKSGIGTEDEDLGEEGEETGKVKLPVSMVERLRIDLSIWKQPSDAG